MEKSSQSLTGAALSVVFRDARGVFTLVLCLSVLLDGIAWAQFDPTGWGWFSTVKLSEGLPEGPAGIPLESAIIEKCRPDLGDLRLVTKDGTPVPFALTSSTPEEQAAEPFPATMYKVSSKPGKWTDVWVDKSGKIVTTGILIRTPSKDFVRKVEIRGADGPGESYVIRMNGLIADVGKPQAIKSLSVFHAENNFRYLHIRILDDDQSPIKVTGISCYPSTPKNPLRRSVSLRVLENRRDPSGRASILIGDLGEARFPLEELSIVSPLREFARSVTLYMNHSETEQSWEKVYEGVLFCLKRDESIAESLSIRVKPLPHRYVKLVTSGGEEDLLGPDKIELTASARFAIFDHVPGREYVLYYGNPQAQALPFTGDPTKFKLSSIADKGWKAVMGRPQTTPQPPKPPRSVQPTQESSSFFRTGLGIAMLLVGLLLLFVLMLKSRSASRRETRRASRLMNTRV